MKGREEETQGASDASTGGRKRERSGGEKRFEEGDSPLRGNVLPCNQLPQSPYTRISQCKTSCKIPASQHWLPGWIFFGGTKSRV